MVLSTQHLCLKYRHTYLAIAASKSVCSNLPAQVAGAIASHRQKNHLQDNSCVWDTNSGMDECISLIKTFAIATSSMLFKIFPE